MGSKFGMLEQRPGLYCTFTSFPSPLTTYTFAASQLSARASTATNSNFIVAIRLRSCNLLGGMSSLVRTLGLKGARVLLYATPFQPLLSTRSGPKYLFSPQQRQRRAFLEIRASKSIRSVVWRLYCEAKRDANRGCGDWWRCSSECIPLEIQRK